MSGLPRHAARRDVNEQPIVDEFERLGCVVQRLSAPGCPDLLVSYLRVLHLAEVKYEDADLTPGQKAWHETWAKAGGSPPEIVRTEAHARKLVRMWTVAFAETQAKRASIEEDLAG